MDAFPVLMEHILKRQAQAPLNHVINASPEELVMLLVQTLQKRVSNAR